MTVEEDFMRITVNAFSQMRLLVEGAISRYEDDTGVLTSMTAKAGEHSARIALNDIGTALYELRRQISLLQDEHRKEDERQRKQD